MPRLFLPLCAALALSASGVAEDTRVNMVFADNAGLDDPVMANHIALATQTGLVVFDEKGQVSPAIAGRWVVSDDGLSYIFRIDDLEWADGEVVTATIGCGLPSSASSELVSRLLRTCRTRPRSASMTAPPGSSWRSKCTRASCT